MGERPSTETEIDGSAAARPTDAEIDAALEALADPERLRRAESRVAALAPQLQHILVQALGEGGWFDEAHGSQVTRAARTPDDDDRIAAVRTLLAEETRLGMLVGVAVGWELARELDQDARPPGHAAPEPGAEE